MAYESKQGAGTVIIAVTVLQEIDAMICDI